MPVILKESSLRAVTSLLRVRLRKVQARLAQQPGQRDQRQADQRGRVFALDFLEQCDAQRFGLETAGAIERLLAFQIALDFAVIEWAETHARQIRKERAPVCASRIDYAYRRVEMHFASAARAQLFARHRKFARLV